MAHPVRPGILASAARPDETGSYALVVEEYKDPVTLLIAPAIASEVVPPTTAASDLRWSDFKVVGDHNFYDVWSPDGRTVYVVGNGGIEQSDDGGASWRTTLPSMQLGVQDGSRVMRAIWGNAKNDVYAVGVSIHHSADEGKTWQELATAELLKGTNMIMDVWSTGDHVFVLGQFVLFHSADRGATWGNVAGLTDSGPVALWGTEKALFVGCYDGSVWASPDHGSTWSNTPSTGAPEGAIKGLWGSGDDLFLYGDDLLLRRTAGGPWTKIKRLPLSPRFVWGTSPDDFYALESQAVFHTRDGGKTWSNVRVTKSWLKSMWGASTDDVYVVGDKFVSHGRTAAGLESAGAQPTGSSPPGISD